MHKHWSVAWLAGATLAAAWLASPAAPARAQDAVKADAGQAASGVYLRSREVDDGVLILELASRAFVPKDGKGPTIYLVSAVHVADATFYKNVQSHLDAMDLVLFEGVKPPGAGALDPAASDEAKAKFTRNRLKFLQTLAEQQRDKTGAFPADPAALAEGAGKRWKTVVQGSLNDAWGRPFRLRTKPRVEVAPGAGAPEGAKPEPDKLLLISDGPNGKPADDDDLWVMSEGGDAVGKKDPGIQGQLAKALGLTFQLDAMDSSKPNWRSSDMSMDELEAAMAAAGGDASALLGILDGSSMMGKLAGVMIGFIGQSPQMGAMMKFLLVEVMDRSEELMGGQAGRVPEAIDVMTRVIVKERNQVVLSDVRSVIDHEPQVKRLAIFYGGGHMPDLARRLANDFGYIPAETTWMEAIRVDPRDAGMSAEQARAMRAAMIRRVKLPDVKMKWEEVEKQAPSK